ncbi:ATP-binding cassette domain-containing protein [Halostella sp. JP-L12]|uniref:phosphonate ABC transporter ATP-binding protein n=1 Tax=Halostella TaxID=1843185 RepID=UPI000EF79436|nr:MULTISPECIES: ATP-binding cassette domain-containing protein [Halostella]NHN49084.1 ATP-binding cassette domain-containing protein [Halostella sp. JP-L12]
MTDAEHELRFDGVSKAFDGEPAVRDVSLRIEGGERVALVGPSGAGKTTLLRIANGSVRPDAGRVTFDGEPATSAEVALAYGGDTLVDRRTALSNVLSGRVGDLPWWRGLLEPLVPSDPGPALELLEAVGLRGKADVRADRLSAGERQRVALARAAAQDAPAVLADEPTANLDPASRSNVLDVLDAVAGDRMLLTVLHDVDLALERYDRVVGLADGRVLFDEPAAQVTDDLLADLFAAGASTPDRDARPDREPALAATTDYPAKEPEWHV